jgi:nitrite reductase/ring-hydroxylating ferredoxin subunit
VYVRDVPIWKDHFPVSWVDDHFVTRREFTKSLLWVSLATCVANGLLAIVSRLRAQWGVGSLPSVQVAAMDALPVGGSQVFHYPGLDDPCLLVRLDADRYVAFWQKCTHLGCPVVYRAADQTLYCPCHAGLFGAADGQVLAGPPSRPLPRVTLEQRGEALWAIGKAS